jgi:hypothetical protein
VKSFRAIAPRGLIERCSVQSELSFSELVSINYSILTELIHQYEAIAVFLGNTDLAVKSAWGEAFGWEAARVIHRYGGRTAGR